MSQSHPIADANESSPFGSYTPDEFYARHSVAHASNYITNARGLKLFTQWWTPLPPAKVIGTLALVHGFTGESSWFLQLTAIHFAKAGFATCAIDHQGHGFSDGLATHIPDINPVVDDCILFFDEFRARYDPSLPSFLYSESLGGAIALLITLRAGQTWDGLHPQRSHVRHQRQVQAAVAPGAPALPRRGRSADVARGTHTRLDPGRVVQGGVEKEAGRGEPEEDGGEATRRHGSGAGEGLQGAAGEVRGGGSAADDSARRRRRRLRPGLCGGTAQTRRE
ncbi:hypothetical protein FEM48_Zijuj04G0122000 [Ziziphus jujuba var. spinosa]|uniref:Serine aminopeptidase S33 domain-containing protein n=1 Tax=Ziziphus jujuba var. spinosa TaxID=714518 RepID=A0A978VJT5_ZIZJJ|nr:hypothetical protein FEM48_Zijuj04G0122000 [Ziziphus jujuba var. spinosa]